MLTLILSVAFIGQQDDYVKGYQPKAGDKVVLAPTSGTTLYVVSNVAKIPDLDKAVKANDGKVLEQMTAKGDIQSVAAETPVVYVNHHPSRIIGADLSEVRVLEGPLKDKVVFCHTAAVKMVDPAKLEARKKAEVAAKGKTDKPDAKPKREPLNADVVAEDVRAAIKKAKAETAKLPSLEQKKQKEKMMKAAIETVCKKHKASLSEINTIATNAKIFVNFDGATYDITGKRIR
jgi:hypothetical protein